MDIGCLPSCFHVLEVWRNNCDKTARPVSCQAHGPTQHYPTLHMAHQSTLPRKDWVKLNCLRTRVGRFNNMLRWDLVKSPSCDCGSKFQTAKHLIYHCPIHRRNDGNAILTAIDDITIQWLQRLYVTS